eukprot:CAMPEP_0119555464 /NCGR_PEP_ID=MMETSP1352-20130426/7667_1 /TAXON_ID=265584 /ORGANISM="Stauroneis constricta, Strain CCMP1120" /LENGTH=268 /DNA_ID=CAMNT_0007602227 /DNA_START=213 /DNA_END=1019 /DNA_ORIENTATION=-
MSTKKKNRGNKTPSASDGASNVPPMEALFGPDLLTKVGKPAEKTTALLEGKDLVCLYFSASWCPPCKKFSPILGEFYETCAKDGKVEIVYVSSDRSIPEFEEYYGKMPFLAIPATDGAAQIKNNLSQLLKIQGIPTLIVLNVKTGEFVTDTARDDVAKVGGRNKEQGMALIEAWKQMETVPISEAKFGGGGPTGIMALVMFFTKNPMFLFGIFYIIKTANKQYRDYMAPSGVPAAPPTIEAVKEVPIVETDANAAAQEENVDSMESEF